MSATGMVIRPVEGRDLDAVMALVSRAGVGLTSLPLDPEALDRRIRASRTAFATAAREPGEQRYLFVLKDTAAGRVAGLCGIQAAVGLTDAFYSYRVGTEVHASRKLRVHRRIPALYLSNDYTGCTEIGSLFMAPEFRHGGNGRLLSKSRLLFLAGFRQRFAETVIAEMRGISDAEGHCPFWEALGRHFFAMDFATADRLSGSGSKSFIAELMPKHPIYVHFLTEEARAVIAQVHPHTRPALRMLEGEGFRYANHIDIFDGGPTLECRLEAIRAVRHSRLRRVRVGSAPVPASALLISNTRLADYRCALAPVTEDGDEACLDPGLAALLGVSEGEPVRVVEP